MTPRPDARVVPDGATLIGDALTRHYRIHGLPPDGGASDAWFRVHIGPLTLRLPNPPARRRAVVLHDINHIVTGYDTTFARGEMAIAGFEVGAGCGRFGIVWYINLSMLALGFLVQPRETFAAFVRGRRSESIYHRARDASALSIMSVGAVRTLLRLDDTRSGPTWTDRVLFTAWSALGFIVLLAPLLVILMASWAVARRVVA